MSSLRTYLLSGSWRQSLAGRQPTRIPAISITRPFAPTTSGLYVSSQVRRCGGHKRFPRRHAPALCGRGRHRGNDAGIIGRRRGVDTRTSFEATPLMWCAGDAAKVRLLVEKGADVNARSKMGNNPLDIAAAHGGNLETVRYLLDHGAVLSKARNELGMTPLLRSAKPTTCRWPGCCSKKATIRRLRTEAAIPR